MAFEQNPYAAPQAAIDNPGDDDEVQEVRLFSVSGRIGRIRYLSYLTGVYLIFAVIIGGLGAGLAASGMRDTTALFVVLGLGYLGMIVLLIMLAVQRCHDFDNSGWWVLLFLVPAVNFFFGLYLLFKGGTEGRNRWGARTSPNSTLSVILACILPVLFVVGIAAAIAIPAYSDYTKRAQRSQIQMPR
jgi:uncharacterized membrane protein YhaH (DUF805 family)